MGGHAEMAKTWLLHPDEWYPVLQLNRYREGNPNRAEEAEFTDAEIAELRELETKFNEWQHKIAKRYKLKQNYTYTLIYEAE
jgi:hypothetical protein